MDCPTKIYSRIGELMQGFLPDGRAFMVSGFSSRQWYSEAVIEADEGEAKILPPKACRALSLLLEHIGEEAVAGMAGRLVSLRGNIPSGKGLASSSCDILSVLSAVNDFVGAGLAGEELYRVAALVEPTDPCLSDDILLFHQHSGVVVQKIALPPMSLLYFDAAPGRVIDTETVVRYLTPGAGRFFDWLLARFLRAVERRNYDEIFDAITASAEYNQTVISLPGFEGYCRLARETGSGLMVAHSGTMAGLLVPPERCAAMRARLQSMVTAPVYSEHYSPIYF